VRKIRTLDVRERSRLLKVIPNLREFPAIRDKVARIGEILTRLHVARAMDAQSGPDAGKTSSIDEQSQVQNLVPFVKVNTLTTYEDGPMGEQNQSGPSAVPSAILNTAITKRKLNAAPRSMKRAKTRAFDK
jgi:hypothetical protein